jgi:hypothetical protein
LHLVGYTWKYICDTHGTIVTSQNCLQIGRYTASVKNTSVRNLRKTAEAIHNKLCSNVHKKKYTCRCASQEGTWWNARIDPIILNASSKWQLSSQFHALPALSTAKDTIIPCREGWKGLEACLDVLEKRKIFGPYQESNKIEFSSLQPSHYTDYVILLH